ncbi:TetR family transcriptional regulator [Paracoccus marcusii]|uniref:TetR family transcriptional regulator n=1 Tax=Paracoccus marcusii TaxID=59779 RepID=UPI0039C8615D
MFSQLTLHGNGNATEIFRRRCNHAETRGRAYPKSSADQCRDLRGGACGSLDVTVAQIAKRAGMSPALAHHYFGSRTRSSWRRCGISCAVMGNRSMTACRGGCAGRLDAIIHASFAPQNFQRETVSAWLNFYALALNSPRPRACCGSITAGCIRT